MRRIHLLACVALLGLCYPTLASAQAAERTADSQSETANQYYEVRTYELGEKGDEKAIDDYLAGALLPALKRQGIGPVGVLFDPVADPADRKITVVIPYDSPDQLAAVQQAVEADQQYLEDAKAYHGRAPKNPPFARIRSELLVAFDCMPQLKVPDQSTKRDERVYELRTYESATEHLGAVKVEMFNNGEVPIFLDSGIQPVFFGRAIVGPDQPNLTYLTVYPNDQARQAAWKAFLAHPDWQVLKNVPKYAGTVSKIHKSVLQAKPYSQF